MTPNKADKEAIEGKHTVIVFYNHTRTSHIDIYT